MNGIRTVRYMDNSVQDSSVHGQFATYYIPLSLDENCFHLALIGDKRAVLYYHLIHKCKYVLCLYHNYLNGINQYIRASINTIVV